MTRACIFFFHMCYQLWLCHSFFAGAVSSMLPYAALALALCATVLPLCVHPELPTNEHAPAILYMIGVTVAFAVQRLTEEGPVCAIVFVLSITTHVTLSVYYMLSAPYTLMYTWVGVTARVCTAMSLFVCVAQWVDASQRMVGLQIIQAGSPMSIYAAEEERAPVADTPGDTGVSVTTGDAGAMHASSGSARLGHHTSRIQPTNSSDITYTTEHPGNVEDTEDATSNDFLSATDCVICMDLLQDRACEALVCGHVYHRTCLLQWLAQRKTCPLCCTPVDVVF